MKKTTMSETRFGIVYMWGRDAERDYTIQLKKPEDREINTRAVKNELAAARKYLEGNHFYLDERLWDTLEKMMAMGLYGLFKVIIHDYDHSISLKYKRPVPEEVRKAYAARMRAQREQQARGMFLPPAR